MLLIVPRGSRSEVIDACITRSPIWGHVQIFHLHEKIHATSDPHFSEILQIGDGTLPSLPGDMIPLPDDIVTPWKNETYVNQFLKAVFLSIHENETESLYIMNRALVTPTNKHADILNNHILQLFVGPSMTYYSFDLVENDTHHLYQQEYLHSIAPGELPPHELHPKLGAPIILLRNLDLKSELCNGTRLLCRGIHSNFIHAEIIIGQFMGKHVFTPRIPLR